MAKNNTRPIPQLTLLEKDKFWKLVPQGKEGCWEWTGGTTTDSGYGCFSIRNWPYRAHRVALYITTGIQPPGFHCCHRCNNPICCRPSHLYWGTALENGADRVKAGTTRNGSKTHLEAYPRGSSHYSKIKPHLVLRGEKIWKSKMTEQSVIECRSMYRSGKFTTYDIARKFSITQTAAFNIVSGKTWKHLPGSVGVGSLESKNNRPKGEAAARSKLSEQQVIEIRREHLEHGVGSRILSKKYGIARSCISGILKGKYWKHIMPTAESRLASSPESSVDSRFECPPR